MTRAELPGRREDGEGLGAVGMDASVGDATARSLVHALLDATAPHVAGILLFGSRLAGTSPGAHSAYDLVVVVDSYPSFYRLLVESGHHHRPPRLLAWLSRVLPPNITSFMPDLPGDPVAKCIVLSGQHFEQALSHRPRDHFLKGRMVQSVGVLWARDGRTRRWIENLLAESRRDVLRWAGPHLGDTFTASELARRMLEVSFRGEVRPERADRVIEVFEAQRERLEETYAAVLDEEARRGTVVKVGDGRYRLVDEPGTGDRILNRLYFVRSKLRATGRWLKHIITFADWLTYIQRKLERRTGQRVELTERERRYPLIFLWPKFLRVLRTLPGGGSGDGSGIEGEGE